MSSPPPPAAPTTASSDLRHPPTPVWWRIALGVVVLTCGGLAYLGAGWLGPRGQAACGVVAFLSLAAACSANLRAVSLRTLGWGLVLQVVLAWLILKFEVGGRRPVYEALLAVAEVITQFLNFTAAGATFVFGPFADPAAVAKAFPNGGFPFAFVALPTIIFVSSFFSVLYHLGVLQLIVRLMARAMMYLMGTSGAETLSAAANVFMGQTEAPLIVKPYVGRMTQSELLALMVGGMATIAGGVMAVYIQMGADAVALLATSVMAAPCGLYLAKLLLPELDEPETRGRAKVPVEKVHANVVDAAAAGASDGLGLALNVGAMLIAFLAFIALFNALLGLISTAWLQAQFWWPGGLVLPEKLSLEWLFGQLFAPVALLMGVEAKDATNVGSLLGTKLVANEFVAYVQLTGPDMRAALDPRSFKLATYALTGFANISSIGIQLGGIGAMAPSRRGDLARLGGRALLAGFLATLINASIAGIMMPVEAVP